MGLFRLVARVGCLRGGAIRLLEEWSPIRASRGGGQNPAYRPSGIFSSRCAAGALAATTASAEVPMARQTRSNDWGFPRWRAYGAGARRRRRCGCATAHGCDEPGDRPAPKSPQQPGALVFLRAPRRRIQPELELFRRPDRRGSRGARGRASSATPTASARPAIMAGAAPATAAAAATRCARSTCSSSRPTPISRTIKAAYRRLAKANHPDVKPGDKRGRRSASRRSRRPMRCCASAPRSGRSRGLKLARRRGELRIGEHEGAGDVGDRIVRRRRHARGRGRSRRSGSARSIRRGR